MTRRRRSSRHRGPHADEVAGMFVHCDGVRPGLDGDPTFENEFLARAAWQAHRTRSWTHEFRQLRPPTGAVAYDGIGEQLCRYWPNTAGWTLKEARRRYANDVESVERFRREHPAEAQEIAEALDDYLADLRALLAIAERARNRDSMSHTWGAYHARRRSA